MMHLRRIQESDLPTVNEIFSEAFGVSPPRPLEYVANLCHTDPDGCLVGIVAGEVVGYAFSHHGGAVGYIGNLAVRQSARAKGYGKALTVAVRDHLAARCKVVGLAVDPKNGRNLELYTSCGFQATLPSCHVYKKLPPRSTLARAGSILTARELGSRAPDAIAQIRAWSGEVLAGLDLTRDLEHFARVYPERLWIAIVDGAVRGFLAYEEQFRGDPWGAVRPAPDDLVTLDALVETLEAAMPDDDLWFHLHTNFPRVLTVLRNRGYRVVGHTTCMVLQDRFDLWEPQSEALFIRPWWS